MEMIYLTKEQADKVRGRHGRYSALEPILADDGNYILPLAVLKDPEHREVFADLGKCKYANIDVIIEIDEKEPEKSRQILSVKSITQDMIDVITPGWKTIEKEIIKPK